MKIPSEIRIGGIDYKVSFKDNIISGGNKLLHAQINYCTSEILIATDESAHDHQCLGLWHEILHGIAAHADLDIGDNTEAVVEILARGIYQVLQDNGRKLFDIAPAEESAPIKSEGCCDDCVDCGKSSQSTGFVCTECYKNIGMFHPHFRPKIIT